MKDAGGMIEEGHLDVKYLGSDERRQETGRRQGRWPSQQHLQLLPYQFLSPRRWFHRCLHCIKICELHDRGADEAHVAATTNEVGVRHGDNLKKRAAEIADCPVVAHGLFKARDVEVVEEYVAARAVVVLKTEVCKQG